MKSAIIELSARIWKNFMEKITEAKFKKLLILLIPMPFALTLR
jgi:hypothetical protein